MVGRAFVGQMGDGGQGIMNGELAAVREQDVQRPLGLLVLQRAVQVGDEVCGGEVDAPIGAVGAGRDGGRIGRPHRGCRTGGSSKGRRVLPCAFQHLCVGATKSKRAQERDVRALVRGEDELRQAKVGQPLHLFQPLQHSRARIGRHALVQAGRQITRRQPCIGVSWPDQAIGIGFDGLCRHYFRPLISFVMFLTLSASKLATG